MSSDADESIPSAKMEEMDKEKIIQKPQKGDQDKKSLKTKEEGSGFVVYTYIVEGIVLLLTIIVFNLTFVDPDIFFEGSGNVYDGLAYRTLKPTAMVIILFVTVLALINTYFHIYKLPPKHRLVPFLMRTFSIVSIFAFPIGLEIQYNFYMEETLALASLVTFYSFVSQYIMKAFLLTTDKPIKTLLFRRKISASPAENDWRKYESLSGILAIITGILMLQLFWLIYHLVIRKILVNHTKNKLIVESMDFDEDINLSAVSLELGIPMEDTIYKLKKLVYKREINGEFTRYGFILKEIRKMKWFTPRMAEKYDNYQSTEKRNEQEVQVGKFFDLMERERMQDKDFYTAFGIRDGFQLEELELLLPANTINVKKQAFTKKKFIIFNQDAILMRRKHIINILMDNYNKIFGKE